MITYYKVKANEHGFYSRDNGWIDTNDNICWSEPAALIGANVPINEWNTCIRMNGQAPLFPNPHTVYRTDFREEIQWPS